MNLRTITLAALLPAGFVLAHDWPRRYDDARMVSGSSLELEAGKTLSITSNALHWRKDILDSTVKSGAMKERMGGNAWLRKVAIAKVPGPMTLGDQAIGEGEWAVSVKVPGEDTSKFILEWKQGDKTIDVPLDMKGGNDVEDHLLMALTPSSRASLDFDLKVFYGDMRATVQGSLGAKS